MLCWLLSLAFWQSAPGNMIAGSAVFLGWRLIAAVNAYRYTARAPACVGRSAWIRWPAYVVIYIVAYYGPALTLRAVAFEAFTVTAGSMSDTLIPGDRLLATKWESGLPERGELVVFRSPSGEPWVKRVIGLPGDQVEVRRGVALVNGEPLEEPYVVTDRTTSGDFGPTEVPAESCFLLGDNRERSKDSRFDEIGFVPVREVYARPRAIFWSVDPKTIDIRWERLGRPLRQQTR